MRSLKRDTVVFKVDPSRPDKAIITYAAAGIRTGKLVAFPTETVYGLAANLLDKKAVADLYRVKRRPKNKPFTVHISDTAQIKKTGCAITKEARALIKKFWPGALTIILRSKGGKKTGFRMPANSIALKLIASSGVPVVAPSANLSTERAPTDAGGVLRGLDGKIDLVLDGGSTRIGIESTVVDLTVKPARILRIGAISEKKILKAIYG